MLRAFQVTSLVIAAGVLSLTGCEKPRPPQMTPMVGVVTIQEAPLPLIADLPGRTNAFAVSQVRPQVNGIVQKRLFTEGSSVKAGQPLYQIDPAPYRATFDSAEASLASAKAKLDRYAVLAKQDAIAAQTFDDTKAAYLQAKAAADAARINLNYTRITAPISGRIGASTVTEGALVTANQATELATISTLDPIYVDISQSSAELLALERAVRGGQIERGAALSAKVTLTLDDGSAYPIDGKLEFTDVTVDPTTGAVRLRALFPNPDGTLLPGLYVRATVIQGIDPHGILVPQRGVSRNEKGEPTVLVVDSQDMARLRVIKTGRAVGGDWQVLDGLKSGDRMIVEGLQKVQPDMKVKPMAASGDAKPAAAAPGTGK